MARMLFAPDGSCRFIYADELAPIARALGTVRVARASNVEPTPDGWVADLSPVGGPSLAPTTRRADALDAEVAWLNDHDIPIPTSLR